MGERANGSRGGTLRRLRDFSLVFLLIGLVMVFISLHNIDIAWNMNLVKDWKYDINLAGEVKTSIEIYLEAWKLLYSGLFLIILAFLMSYLF